MLTKLLTSFGVICIAVTITANAQVTPPATTTTAADSIQNISPEKQALIQELLVVMDSKKGSEAVLNEMLTHMEKTLPDMIWQTVATMKGIEELPAAERERLRIQLAERATKTGQRMRVLLTERYNFAEMVDRVSVFSVCEVLQRETIERSDHLLPIGHRQTSFADHAPTGF